MDEQTQEMGKVDSEHESEPTLQPNGTAQGSIMDGLRELRARKAAEGERRLVLDVPGYEGRLAVIYHYPEGGYQRAVKAVETEIAGKDPLARLDGAADMLVAACAAVVGRNADGALVDPTTDELLGPDELPHRPLRFNKALAEALQIDVPAEVKSPGRHIARQLFSPRGAATGVYDGDLALISTSNAVFAWLNKGEVLADEATLGE